VAGVRISNADRVVYPEQGLTKLALARHFERVAQHMLPYLQGRPLTLVRCPAGQAGPCFYQKHLSEATPAELIPVEVEERSGKLATYVVAESAAGLVALAQLGVLEVHPWGSRRQHLERPDLLVFDLDPGPRVGWEAVVRGARRLRELLAELGLRSFPKLTGGKGLHLVVPVAPELDWEVAKAFARAVVALLAAREPDRYVTVMSKARRPGKIFLDYLRNGFGNTAIAPYSPRARPGAPVAVPVRWQELTPGLPPDRYTVANVGRRLAALTADPWEGFASTRQRVPREVLARLADAGDAA
jgi:bifunctional non-homologous end joining protein LigD